MNQLIGHLRPEHHPGLPRPTPVSPDPARAQLVKEPPDNFLFFILIVCIIWLQGAPVEEREGAEGLSTSWWKDGEQGPTHMIKRLRALCHIISGQRS